MKTQQVRSFVCGLCAVIFTLAFTALSLTGCPDDDNGNNNGGDGANNSGNGDNGNNNGGGGGNGLSFTLIKDGTEYSVKGSSISGAVVIPATYDGKPVTSIGERAFYNCRSLTSITIPASVTSIGYRPFYGWTSSQTIYVPWRSGYKPSEWNSYWNSSCNATIVYQGGS